MFRHKQFPELFREGTLSKSKKNEMQSIFACIITLSICLLWFIRHNWLGLEKLKTSPKQPKTELYSNVRSQIRTGDLLMTRSSNNFVSDLHCKWLNTPISHVGVAVVQNEGDTLTKVFMFESSSGRGAQLRDLEDYVKNGVSDVFIRHLNREDLKISREKVLRVIESLSNAVYSFEFVADIPHKLLGFDRDDDARLRDEWDDEDEEKADEAYSCADLVYRVYYKLGVVGAGVKKSSQKRRWFPKDFFLNKVNLSDFAFGDIRSVFFNDLDQVDKKRILLSLEKIYLHISNKNK